MFKHSAAILCLAVIAALFCNSGHGQVETERPVKQKWRYHAVAVSSNGPISRTDLPSDLAMSNLGDIGWELVTVSNYGPNLTVLYFKQPKP